MSFWSLPWLEYAIFIPLIGSLCVSRIRDPYRASGWGIGFMAGTFLCALLTWIGWYIGSSRSEDLSSFQPFWFGRMIFGVDELSAPLPAMSALIHLLTALATSRIKMRRFSYSWSLAAEANQIAIFGCKDPWVLIGLLILGTVAPCIELINRGKSVRVYVFHMALFAGLLLIGWGFVDVDAGEAPSAWVTVPLLLAILVRSGVIPVHCWITDWFEKGTFGNAILFVVPLTGVYAALRLVLPNAPDWVLSSIGIASIITALYAAGMATIQTDSRRFFAYFFLSHASLVLIGLELHTAISLTGALFLWISVSLSLSGLGLTMRALESRFGRLSLGHFQGLYEPAPTLAVCFLVTGLASIGFPGTLGFIATELLVDGAVHVNLSVGIAVGFTAALNGIAVVRAYLLLFTGARHPTSITLRISLRERIAVLILTALLLIGGLFPQLGVVSRYVAAETLLKDRQAQIHTNTVHE